ncbi:hypothetical protein ACFV4Q_34835 [Streptomyces nojiriensis]|uniref:ATP-dependent DNA ligase n=1 Tax=Streptomyces nojiriensis TaxID=66374 RepID=UPI003653F8C3
MQHDGQELLTRPDAERRALLESLFSEHALTAPWTLVPQTTDLAKAREWPESWTDVSGVEGILVKPLNGRHLPGCRGWTKIRRRDTMETIAGTLTRPRSWSSAATTRTAGCVRSAGPYRCARTPPGRSPSTSPRTRPDTRGRA